MLQGGHSAILSTFIKLPFVMKIFVLSIFEWQFYTGFTVAEDLFSAAFVVSKGPKVIKLFSCSTEHEISPAHKN